MDEQSILDIKMIRTLWQNGGLKTQPHAYTLRHDFVRSDYLLSFMVTYYDCDERRSSKQHEMVPNKNGSVSDFLIFEWA